LPGASGIIHEGRLLQELEVDELERSRQRRLLIGVRDIQVARQALVTAGHPAETGSNGIIALKDSLALEHPDEIARLLVHAGAPPTQLVLEEEDP